MFAPLGFPNGVLLFSFSSSTVSEDHASLSPYESFRDTFLVLGVADGNSNASSNNEASDALNGVETSQNKMYLTLAQSLTKMRQDFPRALSHQLLVFDAPESLMAEKPPNGIICVPSSGRSRSTTMKTAMCDISALLLSDMVAFAKTIQAKDAIDSPGFTMSVRSSAFPEGANGVDLDKSNRDDSFLSDRPMSFPAARNLTPSSQPRSRSRSPANRPMSSRRKSTDESEDFQRSFPDPAHDPIKRPLGRGASKDRRMTRSDSLNASEHAINRLRARQGVVIGSLFTMSGRWADALRELVESTTRARMFNDYMWHAKGLENILVTMLLLVWARIEFTVPAICYPNPEKALTGKSLPSSGLIRTSESSDQNGDGYSRTIANLSAILPDLVHLIINVHNKATILQSEVLPQFPYSECVTRLTYLLTVFYRFDGQVNSRALNFLILGDKSGNRSYLPKETQMRGSAKQDVSSLLFKAFPAELFKSSMSLLDTITILSGMATVLSLARLQRKWALVVRDMLSLLVPRLIQARKLGAAELGIHPAASLAARHGLNAEAATGSINANGESIEQGLHNLLAALCSTFGVTEDGILNEEKVRQSSSSDISTEDVLEYLREYVDNDSVAQSFGGFDLKADILRLCANFSEALPNFQDVIYFTVLLLRTAGSGSAAGAGDVGLDIRLAREEQMRFASKINRTLGVFKATEAAKLECSYWDPFLVRSIDLPTAPTDSELDTGLSKGPPTDAANGPAVNPFIHNAFPQTKEAVKADRTLIAGENSQLIVVMQNLYDFEILIEKIQLIGHGTDFACKPHSAVLAPRRIQQILISATALTEGELRINSCLVKVQGFCEQKFLIFPKPWKPELDFKIKSSGLAVLRRATARPSSLASAASEKVDKASGATKLNATTCIFRVIHAQPELRIISATLPQSTMTMLEGEQRSFTINTRNISTSVPIDFLEIFFVHSAQLESKAVTEASALSSLVRWRSSPEQFEQTLIPADSMHEFVIDVTGHHRLSTSLVTAHIQYAYRSSSNEFKHHSKAPLPMRLTPFTFNIVCVPSMSLQSVCVVRGLGSAISYEGWEKGELDAEIFQIESAQEEDERTRDDQHQQQKHEDALLMDLNNRNQSPLSAVIHMRHGAKNGKRLLRQLVQPGDVARLLVPVTSNGDPLEYGTLMDLVMRDIHMRWENVDGRSGAVDMSDVQLEA